MSASPDVTTISRRLPARPEAAERARRLFDGLNGVPEPALDDARLLTTELVANSVVHARNAGDIELEIAAGPHAIRVEVSDPGGDSAPRVKDAALDDTSGRGLFLVEALADDWGAHVDGRTAVWFRIDL